MQALVMGGTEFISKNVAKYLISKRYSVDIFTRGVKPLTYQGVNAHITGDRLNIEDLRQGLNNK
ncbi:MAG: NAD-dependent epimerase/dehydratase, partial [Firmicutes bacterium]|nr:NAD-dependent epimerase/dehydratase [Bacillota bacterium]